MTNASAIDTHMAKNLNDYKKIIAQALDEMKKVQGNGRRKFTVGFDCVRTTNDAAEYPHFVYKYSPTM